MRTFVLRFSLAIIFFLGISCDKKNDNITQQGEFTGNLSGIWIADETIVGNAQLGNYPQARVEVFKIFQSENTFKLVINDKDTSSGKITGNTIQWNGTRIQDNVTITIDFKGQISSDGKTFTGTGSWNAQSSTYNETGTMNVSAWKSQNRKINLSGQWQGTYASFDGYSTGDFSVNLIQLDSIIGGTIKIPALGMSDEEITGKIIDNCWSFGDINNRIKFIGVMDKDSLHFRGSYSYGSNEGKWNAAKTSDSTQKMLVVISSFPVTSDYNSDLSYDGQYLWLVNDKKLCKYSKEGKLVDSIYTPGNYPVGLTFDGTNLISADGEWGSNKIYFLSPNGDNVYKAPEGSISGIAFNENNIWCLDGSGKKIYKSSKAGKVSQTISISDALSPSGLTYADNHLWYTDFDQSEGKIKIVKLDLNGNPVSSFITEGFFSGGLSFDGTHLLFVSRSEDKIFLYSLDGTLFSKHDIDLKEPSQIAYDGSSIWIIANKDNYSWMSPTIYKLNSSYKAVDSLKTPTNDIGCLAYANNYFWYYNQNSQKIIRVSQSGGEYFANPAPDADYLCYSNFQIWGADNMQSKIYNFSTAGTNLSSFSSPIQEPKGITIDGNVLWIIFTNSNYKTALCKSSLYGEKIEEMTSSISQPSGLVFDGEFFWTIGWKTSMDPSRYLFKMKIK